MRGGSAFKGSTHASAERELAHVQPHRGSIAAHAARPCSAWEAGRGGPCVGRGVCRGRTHAAEAAVMEPGALGGTGAAAWPRESAGPRGGRAGVRSAEPPL